MGGFEMDYSKEVYDMYDQMIDDCSEEVKIGNITFSPSRVLKELDPIAYRCGLGDYLDSLAQDGVFCFKCEQVKCECEEEE
tara:strand:+ start:442 stop:684 length:243 start_codon:yes stop_codon:yes gene_type:complete